MDNCVRCGNELNFDSSAGEIYNYIDSLCDECIRDLRREEYEDDWRDVLPVEFPGETSVAVNELGRG